METAAVTQVKHEMRIAPRSDQSRGHWTVGNYLELDLSTEEGWQVAITIFQDRIRGRFLDPITKIDKLPFAGFAVLALDCLLIETLQQFREGLDQTPYGKGAKYFAKSLKFPPLDQHFCESVAEDFYRKVRCGILHQGEVKGAWLVRTTHDLPAISQSPDGSVWIVQRRKFHACVVEAFDRYVSELRCPGSEVPRKHFKMKMNHICGLPSVE